MMRRPIGAFSVSPLLLHCGLPVVGRKCAKTDTTSTATKQLNADQHLVVLFGSQTGTMVADLRQGYLFTTYVFDRTFCFVSFLSYLPIASVFQSSCEWAE